jgi:uncharacterized small protein (DUF1192 family)
MKTPEQWETQWYYDWENTRTSHLQFIEAIQRDALNSPFANTTDQEELELAHDVNENLGYRIELLTDEVARYKAKWHEARRYLRAANRGAERNNQVMRLLASDVDRLQQRIKQLEQTNQ